jgi:hypothetical protein
VRVSWTNATTRIWSAFQSGPGREFHARVDGGLRGSGPVSLDANIARDEVVVQGFAAVLARLHLGLDAVLRHGDDECEVRGARALCKRRHDARLK